MLAVSSRGPWVVDPDGSKRLLGAYRSATWSPFGRFIVATKANELDTLEPEKRFLAARIAGLHGGVCTPPVSG